MNNDHNDNGNEIVLRERHQLRNEMRNEIGQLRKETNETNKATNEAIGRLR
jgi:hypothetical protein